MRGTVLLRMPSECGAERRPEVVDARHGAEVRRHRARRGGVARVRRVEGVQRELAGDLVPEERPLQLDAEAGTAHLLLHSSPAGLRLGPANTEALLPLVESGLLLGRKPEPGLALQGGALVPVNENLAIPVQRRG